MIRASIPPKGIVKYWLITMAYQLVWYYFKPRKSRLLYVHIYIFGNCSSKVTVQSNCIRSYQTRISLNRSIWHINRTLKIPTTPSQSGPRSNSNERVLHTLQSSRTRRPPWCSLVSHSEHAFLWYLSRAIGLMSKVFTSGPGDRGSILGRHTKDSKNLIWCRFA